MVLIQKFCPLENIPKVKSYLFIMCDALKKILDSTA